MRKSTELLTNEIIAADSIDQWREDARESLAELTLPEYLAQLLAAHGVSKKAAISAADLDTTYGYQIFQGRRHPGRNHLLRLAIGIGCSIDETKRLLCYGDCGTLYPRVGRDAYLMYAIHNHYSVAEANRLLFEHGEETV